MTVKKLSGLFVPTEVTDRMTVLRSSVAGRTEPTPTEPDKARTVLAPVLTAIGNKVQVPVDSNLGGVSIELECGHGLADLENFPDDRPQLSSEIENAIRAGKMTLMTCGGHGAITHRNCDHGSNEPQMNGLYECGMYYDHPTLGSLAFHKNDPVVDGNPGDMNYFGKSRPPVHDFVEAAKFYKEDGETRYDVDEINDYSIYSDGDFIYAIALVCVVTGGGLAGGNIVFFRFDPYKRIFIERGRVNEMDSSLSYLSAANANVFTAANFKSLPARPCMCRIKSDKNKLVAAYLAIFNGDNNTCYLVIAHSFDNGRTWETIQKVGRGGFFEYLCVPLLSFNLKMACNGDDLLVVWAVDSDPTSIERQMRCLRSRDGGRTFDYSSMNMFDMFMANEARFDNVDSGVLAGISSNVYFGLTVNSDNLFVIAKTGDGLTDDANGINAMQYVLFYCAEGGSTLDWKQCGKININTDYNANIDGYDQNRIVGGVELFTDHIHGWDYALMKMYCGNPEAGFQADNSAVIVRYKILTREEWTTAPDWVNTGIASERNADYIMMMEPPNRNMAFYAPTDTVGALLTSFYMSGTCHRGHVFIMNHSSDANYNYPYVVCMKAWTNVPINYGLKQSYLPVCGSPVNQGWVRMTPPHINIVETNTIQDNEHQFAIVPNGVYAPGISDYYEVSSAVSDASLPVGKQEFVVRFVIARGEMDPAQIIRIIEYNTAIWNAALAVWRAYDVCVDMTGTGFKIYPYGDGMTWVAVTTAIDEFWEFMIVVSGYEFSLYKRLYNVDTNSAVVQPWTFVVGGIGSDNGAWGGTGYIRIGCILTSLNLNALNTQWKYKGLWSSKSFIDTAPLHMHYRYYISGAPVTFDPTQPGVLSSERMWKFDRFDVANNARLAVRGEFISPNPVWIGTDWLALCDSRYSRLSAPLWLTMKDFFNGYTRNMGSSKHHGLLVGPPSANVLPFGLTFSGMGQYIDCGDHNEYDLTDNFTITAWIYSEAPGFSRYILAKTPNGANNTGYGLLWDYLGKRLWLTGAAAMVPSNVIAGSVWHTWMMVTVTVSAGYVLFYKNNALISGGGLCGAIPVNTDPLMVGANSAGGASFEGKMTKVGLFNRVLSGQEIDELYKEGPWGPQVPSDFFVRTYGDGSSPNDTWKLEAKDHGGAAENVLDTIPGTKYDSNRDGLNGVLPGGVGYNGGDVEVVLCTEDKDYITGNAVTIMGCNATDVKVWAQDAVPSAAGWGGATDLGHFQLHHRDDYDDMSLSVLTKVVPWNITNGVLTGGAWREGAYVNKRMLICPSSHYDHYNGAAAPEDNWIQKCIYNSEDRMQFDEQINVAAANPLYVRQLADRCVIALGSNKRYKYWRFVFTNNASNGDLIEVGHIAIGNLMMLDENTSSPTTITIIPEEVEVGNNFYSYNIIKKSFEITLNKVPRIGNNDIDRIIQAYKQSMRLCNMIYFVNIYDDDTGSTLVYACQPDGDLQMTQEEFPNCSISLKLKEI